MNKYRLCFIKEGDAKFVSHLDLIRLFTRTFLRAKLPIAYSGGFNPHPKMSIGLPLSVGVSSSCEYMDIELEEWVEPYKMISALNSVMPIGIKVIEAAEITSESLSLSDIASAHYQVTAECSPIGDEEILGFLQNKEIVIEKRTKRGVNQTDIKKDILQLRIQTSTGDSTVFYMKLSAGNKANLKPDTVLAAMEKYIEGFKVTYYDVHRNKITNKDDRKFI